MKINWRTRIRYLVKKSKFLNPCEIAISLQSSQLKSGKWIPINLATQPPGYIGDLLVKIDSTDYEKFWTDVYYKDPTRFPARIKAAATALRNLHHFGIFKIIHKKGQLTIEQVYSNS